MYPHTWQTILRHVGLWENARFHEFSQFGTLFTRLYSFQVYTTYCGWGVLDGCEYRSIGGRASVLLVVVPHRYSITEKSIFLHFDGVRQDWAILLVVQYPLWRCHNYLIDQRSENLLKSVGVPRDKFCICSPTDIQKWHRCNVLFLLRLHWSCGTNM